MKALNSQMKTARGAGILYIGMDIFMIFSGMIVDAKLFVPGDTVATVSNILASMGLFRLGFVSNLVGYFIFLILVLVLYKLFQSVDKGQAILMVILVVVGVSITYVNMLNQVVPILLLSGAENLSVFYPAQVQTLSMVFFEIYQHGVQLSEIFWGLWLVPLGVLVYKSGFIPKVLGILLMVGCCGHLFSFLLTFLFPDSSATLMPIAEMLMIAELPIFLWLLIKGVKDVEETPLEKI